MSEKGEVAGVEDAYVHFDNIGGAPLDVMVGQFQACDPLMKRELRLTYEDYLIYKTRIGRSNINLAYDRGVIVAWDLPTGTTDVVAMILNGNGKDRRREPDSTRTSTRTFPARGPGPGAECQHRLFRLLQGEELGTEALDDECTLRNRVQYHGPDLKAGNGTLDFSFQYLLRRDTNPDFLSDASRVETDGLVGELVISPHKDRSRHTMTLLYNRIDSDSDVSDYESFTVAVSRLSRRNLRVTAEYTFDIERDGGRASDGVVSAF